MPQRRIPRLFPRPVRGLIAQVCLGAVILLAAACASKSEFNALESRVQKAEQGNQVQDQRLGDLERGTTAALDQQAKATEAKLQELLKELEAQRQEVAALRKEVEAAHAALDDRLLKTEGSVRVLSDQGNALTEEQKRQMEVLERSQAEIRTANRRFEEQVKAMQAYRAEQEELTKELHQLLSRQLAELQASQERLAAVETLLKSPIGGLPAKTEADKAFRQAMYLMMDTQLDLAADRFGDFRATYPDDPRAVEALFRQAQCYYLLRRFDHALVPAFDVVDHHADHPRAEEARWIVARSLEETGDFALARRFYAEMIQGNSRYKADAIRRVQFLNELQPTAAGDGPALPAAGAPGTGDAAKAVAAPAQGAGEAAKGTSAAPPAGNDAAKAPAAPTQGAVETPKGTRAAPQAGDAAKGAAAAPQGGGDAAKGTGAAPKGGGGTSKGPAAKGQKP